MGSGGRRIRGREGREGGREEGKGGTRLVRVEIEKNYLQKRELRKGGRTRKTERGGKRASNEKKTRIYMETCTHK